MRKHAEYLAKYAAGYEYVILGFILIVVAIAFGGNLYWVISDFFNPEFYALRQLPGWRN